MSRPTAQERLQAVVLRFHPYTPALRILLDTLAWATAALVAIFLRFGLTLSDDARDGLVRALPVFIVLQVLSGYAVGLYRQRWRYGSHDEVAALVMTAFVTTSGLYLLNEFYFANRPIPQSVVLIGGVIGLLLLRMGRGDAHPSVRADVLVLPFSTP